MARPTPELPEETGPTRRTFLHAGTTALLLGGAGALSAPGAARAEPAADERRRRVAEQAARDGLPPARPDRPDDLRGRLRRRPDHAGELQAPRTGPRDGPELPRHGPRLQQGGHRAGLRQAPRRLVGAAGEGLPDHQGQRLQPGPRRAMYKEIFDGLPASKQEAIRERARELKERAGSRSPATT